MFCTTLRQRHDLRDLLPFLSSFVNPKLRESDLRTHDLALARPVPLLHSSSNQQQQKPHQAHAHPRSHSHSQSYKNQHHHHDSHSVALPNHLFLILTPESTTPANLPDTLTRITNFVAFIATTAASIPAITPRPRPKIAFILPSSSSIPLHAYTILQTSIYSLPLALVSSLTLLPIPNPQSLLPFLLSHLAQQQQHPPPSDPSCAPRRSFLLLRHATITAPARLLPEHPAHVLSDLYPSLGALAVAANTQVGKETLREWIDEEEAEGVIEFWEGEKVVGR